MPRETALCHRPPEMPLSDRKQLLIRAHERKFTNKRRCRVRGARCSNRPIEVPEANGIAERFVRTVLSECLDGDRALVWHATTGRDTVRSFGRAGSRIRPCGMSRIELTHRTSGKSFRGRHPSHRSTSAGGTSASFPSLTRSRIPRPFGLRVPVVRRVVVAPECVRIVPGAIAVRSRLRPNLV